MKNVIISWLKYWWVIFLAVVAAAIVITVCAERFYAVPHCADPWIYPLFGFVPVLAVSSCNHLLAIIANTMHYSRYFDDFREKFELIALVNVMCWFIAIAYYVIMLALDWFFF